MLEVSCPRARQQLTLSPQVQHADTHDVIKRAKERKHDDILKLLVKVASTGLGIRQLVAIRVSNNASNAFLQANCK